MVQPRDTGRLHDAAQSLLATTSVLDAQHEDPLDLARCAVLVRYQLTLLSSYRRITLPPMQPQNTWHEAS